MDFTQLYQAKAQQNKKHTGTEPTLLCLDPGGTTGWALFEEGVLIQWGQSHTFDQKQGTNGKDNIVYWNEIHLLLNDFYANYNNTPIQIICEDYKVYQTKLQQHSFSPVLTLRLIGAIEYFAWLHDIPIKYQMAATAKGFCTDEKLKEWGYWQEGMKHSRDAIRHGCYHLLFNVST